jgi:hypothetical protein
MTPACFICDVERATPRTDEGETGAAMAASDKNVLPARAATAAVASISFRTFITMESFFEFQPRIRVSA